jgi:tRNA(Ile)-lysidine synthase
MVNLFKRVEKFVNEKNLVSENDKILLAVSGGPDSVFLFHFFIYLLKRKKIEIKVSYIHHHLRKEADKEVEFVKKLADSFNIEFFRGDIEIKEKRNIEKNLREKRYEKLFEIAKLNNCNKIAVGHTLDDNIETVLMNFFRGSGITGICGIFPERRIYPYSEIKIIRPLLCIEKKEINDYLKENGIEYMIDASNLSLNFYRNRIRNQIIPFLLKFSPSLKKNIFRMTEILQKEEEFLREYTEKTLNEISEEKNGKIVIDIEKFKNIPVNIKRRIAGYIYRKVKNTDYVNYRIVEKVLKFIEKKGGIEKEEIEKFLKGYKEEKKEFFYKIEVPGQIEIHNGIKIITEFVNFSEGIFKNKDKFTGYFDWSKIRGNIIVRNRRKGDRFMPLGFKKEKKLSRFMIDKKIPEEKRDDILIFENNGKIMWVCGYEISEHFKVEKNTEKVLKISTLFPTS